jgi:hypothetical protein
MDNTHLFITVMEAGKSNIKVCTGTVSEQSLVNGNILLFPHLVEVTNQLLGPL